MSLRKKKKVPHFTHEYSLETDEIIDGMLTELKNGSLSVDELLTELEEIIEEHPLYPTVFYAMGVGYALKGDYKEAIEYFTKASQLNPFFLEAMYNNALSHLEIGDAVGYMTWLSELLEIGGREKKNEIVIQAKADLDEVDLKIRKTHGTDVHTFLKNQKRLKFALEKMDEYRWNKAIDVLKSLAKKIPVSLSIWDNLAICYRNLGDDEQASIYSKKHWKLKNSTNLNK